MRNSRPARIGWAATTAIGVRVTTAALTGASDVAAGDTSAGVRLTRISSDPFTNARSQHATENDPGTHAYGSTVVAAFAQGLFSDDTGASGIGFATSADRGRTWIHGSLPAITTYTGGPFSRAAFPAVTYDRKHRTWLIASIAGRCATADCAALPLTMAVLVSRSTDSGRTWSDPVIVARSTRLLPSTSRRSHVTPALPARITAAVTCSSNATTTRAGRNTSVCRCRPMAARPGPPPRAPLIMPPG
jgi:hypothetical protein